MAIWGAWSSVGGNAMRVGVDWTVSEVDTNSGTFTVTLTFSTQNQYQYADTQTLTYTGSLSGSDTFQNNLGNGGIAVRGTHAVSHTYSTWGASPGTISVTATLSGAYNGSTPSVTATIPIPARPYAAPAAPAGVTAVRNSDTSSTVSWTSAATAQAPWSHVQVDIDFFGPSGWSYGGTYVYVASVTGATSYTATGLSGNMLVAWRIRAVNPAGQSALITPAWVYMTPAAPTGVASAASGGGTTITTTWTNQHYSAVGSTTLTVQRSVAGGAWTQVAAGLADGTVSWVDPSPGGGANQYRVAATNSHYGGMTSAWATGNVISTAPVARTVTVTDPAGSADTLKVSRPAVVRSDSAGSTDSVALHRGVARVDSTGATDSSTRLRFTDLVVTDAAGSADALVKPRINYCTNPSFETALTTGWVGVNGATIAATQNTAMPGGTISCVVFWATKAAGQQSANYTWTGLTIGQAYTASCYLYVPAGSISTAPCIRMASPISLSGNAVTVASTWTRSSVTFTATATSHTVAIITSAAATSGHTCYLDAILLEAGSTLGSYFDGSTPPARGVSRAWLGASHLSASIERTVDALVVRHGRDTVEDAGSRDRIVITGTATVMPSTPRPTYELPAPSRWRYVALRLDGEGGQTWLDLDLPLASAPTITTALSGAGGMTATVEEHVAERVAADGRPVLEPWSTAIFAEAAGQIRGGGILTEVDWDREGKTANLTMVGFSGYMFGMTYTDTSAWVQVDPLDVFRHAWVHLQSKRRGNLGVTVDPTTSPVRIGTVATDVEFTTGTGEQVSFEAGPYKLAWWKTDDIGDEMTKLASSTPFDWREAPAWSADHQRLDLRIELGYPRLGGRRRDLRFAVGENIDTAPPERSLGEDYSDEVTVVGAGDGAAAQHGWAARSGETRLRRAITLVDRTLESARASNASAAAELAKRLGIPNIESITVTDSTNAPLGSWQDGDDILVQLDSWSDWFRVTATTFSPYSDTATLSLLRVGGERPPVTAATKLTVWQLPWVGGTQSMGYQITTGTYTLAIDGGMVGNAAAFAAKLGTRVNAWVITHPHPDHVGALTEILNNRRDISIGAVYASLPSVAWVHDNEPTYEADLVNLLAALAGRGITVTPLTLGQRLDLGGLQVDILGVHNPEIVVNAINNSSVALRVAAANRAVLFLGDLGPEGGSKLLSGPTAYLLPSDTVQMAHHGQNGVTEDVYAAIRARTCLWPTPKWLWDNDDGGGPGSGDWDTLVVRGWMDKLRAEQHIVAWRGDQLT